MNWPDKDHEETTKMLPMATSATMRKPVPKSKAKRQERSGIWANKTSQGPCASVVRNAPAMSRGPAGTASNEQMKI